MLKPLLACGGACMHVCSTRVDLGRLFTATPEEKAIFSNTMFVREMNPSTQSQFSSFDFSLCYTIIHRGVVLTSSYTRVALHAPEDLRGSARRGLLFWSFANMACPARAA